MLPIRFASHVADGPLYTLGGGIFAGEGRGAALALSVQGSGTSGCRHGGTPYIPTFRGITNREVIRCSSPTAAGGIPATTAGSGSTGASVIRTSGSPLNLRTPCVFSDTGSRVSGTRQGGSFPSQVLWVTLLRCEAGCGNKPEWIPPCAPRLLPEVPMSTSPSRRTCCGVGICRPMGCTGSPSTRITGGCALRRCRPGSDGVRALRSLVRDRLCPRARISSSITSRASRRIIARQSRCWLGVTSRWVLRRRLSGLREVVGVRCTRRPRRRG